MQNALNTIKIMFYFDNLCHGAKNLIIVKINIQNTTKLAVNN